MSYDAVKLVALLAMTLDHVGSFLLPQVEALRLVGRLAAPLFCFLVGWNRQYRFRGSLLVGAAVMSAVDIALMGVLPLNILWGILAGRALLHAMDRQVTPPSPAVMVLALVVWLPLSLMLFDYGALAWLWMLWGRAVRDGQGRSQWVYGISGALLGSAAMIYGFDMTLPWQVAMMAIFGGLCVVMPRFRLREYAPKRWMVVAQLLSRQALPYYVAHRAALMLLAWKLGSLPASAAWL